MKRYPGRDGGQRLWYKPDEIEEIMEHELAKAGLMPTTTDSSVDIEAFLERHLKVRCDQYAPLPAEILGLTQFRAGQKPWVRINQDLTQTALDDEDRPNWVVGRWRATLAHEASHVILHACLFASGAGQGTLFAMDDEEPEDHSLHRCLKRDVLFRGQASNWREVQANMGMAALLMPRKVFVRRPRRRDRSRPDGMGDVHDRFAREPHPHPNPGRPLSGLPPGRSHPPGNTSTAGQTRKARALLNHVHLFLGLC